VPAERIVRPGGVRPLDGSGRTLPLRIPADDLATHAVAVGMTGSGKTGLLMVLVEEALRSSIPVVMIDIKGDFPNLLMMFPHLSGEDFAPWIDEGPARRAGSTPGQEAERVAQGWRAQLADWRLRGEGDEHQDEANTWRDSSVRALPDRRRFKRRECVC